MSTFLTILVMAVLITLFVRKVTKPKKLVQVKFSSDSPAYTYETTLKLEPSNYVEVPGSAYDPMSKVGVVVALGSNYTGPTRRILRKLTKAQMETFVPRRTEQGVTVQRPTIASRFDSECPACYRDINRGETIVKTGGQWVHQRCA